MTRLTEEAAINALSDVSDALGGVPVSCITRQIDVSIKADGQVVVCKWEDDTECPGQRKGTGGEL